MDDFRGLMAPIFGNRTTYIKVASPADDDIMGSLIVVVTDIGAGIFIEGKYKRKKGETKFQPNIVTRCDIRKFPSYIDVAP